MRHGTGKKALADRRGMREGFTTGACSAAAARAATRTLVKGSPVNDIRAELPNGTEVCFEVVKCVEESSAVTCVVKKDAGDDPDVTHGALLTARVCLRNDGEVRVDGGTGVARVTLPGLGLRVGGAAINPVPMRNIIYNVRCELPRIYMGANIVISVPGGEGMAKGTLNSRLGLIGGISILGTTGIVKPYSTAAYKASVVQAIDVAIGRGRDVLVVTTGGKSEQYAMGIFSGLPEDAFIQVGDFVGIGLRHAKRRSCDQVVIVGMVGKLSKMANGAMQTHQAGSKVDHAFLAELCANAGASTLLCNAVANANTARHVLELCSEYGFHNLPKVICQRVADVARGHVSGGMQVSVLLVDFGGQVLGKSDELSGEAG